MKYNLKTEEKKVVKEIDKAKKLHREGVKGLRGKLWRAFRDRSPESYVESLRGVDAFFSHVRKLPKKQIIDLGTGTARAIHGLSEGLMGEGLSFKGIDVVRPDQLNDLIGNEHFIETSVEELGGIDDESCGGLLSVAGALSYTASIPLSILSIDRVLVPGGILKASLSPGLGNKKWPYNERNRQIIDWLKSLGYDVSLKKVYLKKANGARIPNVVLIAIKPPLQETSAKELLEKDLESWEKQMGQISEERRK
ncbi:hypothetical protein JW752_05210 [Candidatus Peregrinibacteria bacterium]|nr:hypothetical protein [Candidatus Peregrinibacteria bacterium]